MATEQELAKASFWVRARALVPTISFAIAVSVFAAIVGGSLAGDNETRVVLGEPIAQQLQATLTDAQADIDKAVQEMKSRGIPIESARSLLFAKDRLELVKKYLQPEPKRPSWIKGLFFSDAKADTLAPQPFPVKDDSFRRNLMMFVIGVITLFGAVCLVLYFRTSDAEKLKFADNMIRTIIGFYIGIVTGLLGIPPS